MKKALAILLAVLMLVALFSACAETEQPTPDKPADDKPVTPDEPSDEPDDVEPEDNEEEEEIVEIEFYWRDMGNFGGSAGTPAVEEAINKITEEKAHVHVNFTWIANSDYATQVQLAVANGEQVDVLTSLPFAAAHFQTFINNGVFMDCSEYLDEYGQGIKEILGDLLNITNVGGKQLAIPNYRNMNSNSYVLFRVDVLEQLGIADTIDQLETWDELEAIYERIKNECENINYAVGTGDGTLLSRSGAFMRGEKLSDTVRFDTLGDSTSTIYSDQEGHVGVTFFQPECVEMCKMGADWMAKGYVYPDSIYSNNGLGSDALVGQGVLGTYFQGSEFGVDTNKSQLAGVPVHGVMVVPGVVATTNGQNWAIGLGASCKEPEAAMKFINLLYTDAELMNLITWGIEGENYVMVNGEACYPEGKDASTCGYHGMSFAIGNQFLVKPWQGDGEGFFEMSEQDFLGATFSKYMGLVVDATKCDDLVAAMGTLRDQYWYTVSCGGYTDELYQEYCDKLRASNVEDYVAVYQAAVNDFLK